MIAFFTFEDTGAAPYTIAQIIKFPKNIERLSNVGYWMALVPQGVNKHK
jgi:hypothetical protein